MKILMGILTCFKADLCKHKKNKPPCQLTAYR